MPLCEGCIFNASGCIGGEPDLLFRLVAGNSLNEANRPNGDQIVLVHTLGVVFFLRRQQKEKSSGKLTDRKLSRDVGEKWYAAIR